MDLHSGQFRIGRLSNILKLKLNGFFVQIELKHFFA